ncbi:hypothetical protein NL676_033528 [Syzygium grande]|nr:hypothetical protein NL676_033528 [Syzygium grande]
MESGPNNVVPEDFQTVQMHDLWSPPMGGGDFWFVQGQTPNQMAGASTSDLPSVFREMSEKLLGDNVVVGDDSEDVEAEGEPALEDTGIYLELKGLIEKSCDWNEYTSELGSKQRH